MAELSPEQAASPGGPRGGEDQPGDASRSDQGGWGRGGGLAASLMKPLPGSAWEANKAAPSRAPPHQAAGLPVYCRMEIINAF